MSLSEKKIYLDFQLHNMVTVNAKQNDAESRYINIICTDKGKKIVLNSANSVAYVRFKKSDGKNLFQEIDITADGSLQIKLTQQMLAVTGKQKVDILIAQADGIKTSDISQADTYEKLNAPVISTMVFYINVFPTAIDNAEIESVSDYSGLSKTISRLVATENYVEKTENSRISAENSRVSAENERKNAENNRQTAENERKNAENNRQNAENNRVSAENSRVSAENERKNTLNKMNTAITNADNATTRANTAAKLCEGIADNTEVVLKKDLYVNEKIVNSKINTTFSSQSVTAITSGEDFAKILGKIAAYMNSFDSRQKILYNSTSPTTAPSNSLGSNGDIYLKVIEE